MTTPVSQAERTLDHPSGNAIPALQNDNEALNLLAARSNRYQCAFNVFSAQFVLAVVVPIVLSLLQSFVPATRSWAAAYGAAMVLLFEPWFDRLQQRFREQAARVQEVFDRRLFDLPWPDASFGQPTSTADISIWADAGRRASSETEQQRWRDWYPAVAGGVTIAVARVICQQANAWWDARQRERSINLLRVGGSLLAVSLVTIALVADFSFSVFLEHLMTVAPLVSWCLREADRHERTVRARERVMDQADRLIDAAVRRSIGDTALASAASDLQRDIYETRRDGPLMLPFIYDCFRDKQESAMCDSAEKAVRRYQSEPRVGGAA